MMLNRNRQRGFTLIELLIVVAIIGIIAAILIPNLIDALQKAKQKRSVSDIRNTGTAWMSWLTDQISAAAAGGQPYNGGSAGLEDFDYDDLLTHMNSTDNPNFFYMQETPEVDGWKNEYEFARNTNLLAANVLAICSYGRDGTADVSDCEGDHAGTDTGAFIATNYDHDIMWADGYFVKVPGGLGGASAAATP